MDNNYDTSVLDNTKVENTKDNLKDDSTDKEYIEERFIKTLSHVVIIILSSYVIMMDKPSSQGAWALLGAEAYWLPNPSQVREKKRK